MKKSTLFILFIIPLLFFSCFNKKQEKYDIEILNAVLKDKVKQNDRRIRRFWVVVSGEGLVSGEEKITYQKAIDIQKKRNKVLDNLLQTKINKSLCEEYETILRATTIVTPTNRLTKEGHHNLKKIDTRLKLYQQNQSKSKIEQISWMFTCLELELYYLATRDFDVSNNGVGGGGAFGTNFYYIFYDSILNVEEEKKVIFLPPLFKNKKVYIHPDTLVFQINGSEEQIPYEWENLNGLATLRFTPPKVGNYEIKGSLLISFQDTLDLREFRWKKYFDLKFKTK